MSLPLVDKRDELKYQKAVKTFVLMQALGWNANQIEEQKSMRLGSTDRLVPDIIVNKNDRHQFVVEFKRPGHTRSEKDIEQLISYMRQLETSVGVYIGDELEVHYKVIGDGSAPDMVLSTRFVENSEHGNDFINLFKCEDFSVERIMEYLDAKKAKEIFDSNVKNLVSQLLSQANKPKWKEAIASYLLSDGVDIEVVAEAMERINVAVIPIQIKDPENVAEELFSSSPIKELFPMQRQPRQRRSRKDPNSAGRYGYNLIRQIVEKNPGKTFEELYSIFGAKNHIIRPSDIPKKALHRWCLDEDDIITLFDGTQIAISNQWGFNNTSKPRLDNLRYIARRYGITI